VGQPDQGYRNRYNHIDCGHKKELLFVLNDGQLLLLSTPGSKSLPDVQKTETLFISEKLQLPFGLPISLYLLL
jgi:hypothetical protein